jgi:VIT1/CCC1 family predicted Fe2+/Mn2+ transporter
MIGAARSPSSCSSFFRPSRSRIPFLVIDPAVRALRVCNLIAIVMLFITGYAFGQLTHRNDWLWDVSMVVLGGALAGLTMILGG